MRESEHGHRRSTTWKPFFPVALNLDARLCVVIGPADDPEALDKTRALEEAGARVRQIYDASQLHDADLIDAFFVISTPQDSALSARLRALADQYRFLLCCIDQPKYGFVAMAAIAKAGPVRVAISTAGLAPRVGKALKNGLQKAMDGKFSRFVTILAERRERVRAEHPRLEESNVRRGAMLEAARGFRADVHFEYPAWYENDAKR